MSKVLERSPRYELSCHSTGIVVNASENVCKQKREDKILTWRQREFILKRSVEQCPSEELRIVTIYINSEQKSELWTLKVEVMEGEVLRQGPFDQDFYNRDLYIWQWFQFVYQSQLLLAERKQKRKAETHKTVPCQAWKDTGRCNYGKRCKFAHGPEELRPMPKAEVKLFNNPRYRTALCIKYTTFGYCPYGDQCHFIHDPVRIDLEKCLDWLSGSSLPSPQFSSEQTNDYLDNASSSGAESETTNMEEWRRRNQFELTSESECLKTKSESCRESESVSLMESVLENNVIEAKTAHDPFRSNRICNEEIELQPLQFNVFNDFLYVINPQSVLPKKQ